MTALPESALACRALYDVRTGGYHLPVRVENRPLRLSEVPDLRVACTHPQYDCIEVPVADLLYSVLVNTRSRLVLETGTSRGFSTCHLAAAARFDGGESDARVITIDPSPTPHPFFEHSALAASIRTVPANSLTFDVERAAHGEPFDFMFFDSLHTYAHLSGELSHFLPWLKLGGLFALHDTMAYDDLGLVVLAALQHPAIEALSLPTHRRHAEGGRSPGVTLFRKVAPIGPGDLLFPDLDGVVSGEKLEIIDPAPIVARSGAVFTDARYVSHDMHRAAQRDRYSPALIEPRAAPGAAKGTSLVAKLQHRLTRGGLA